jgi:hypothetical protein
MFILPRVVASTTMLVGVISIAATLFLEMRRDRRRSRLVRNVESVLHDADLPRTVAQDLKRAA